ncbi:MAG: hypothetical protein JRG76_03650 [Deltaproteobacteria bacterium]|nr:hypothetical protein [Deltaproteobacteria bacterium]MBW2413584.1 hypothetical protein [Deltaproteobacteria bacterium]
MALPAEPCPLISDPHRARRLARVLCQDVALSTGDQVRLGLEKDDLFDRVGRDIEQALVFYRHRVDPALADAQRIFEWAVVDMLVYAHRRVGTHIW